MSATNGGSHALAGTSDSTAALSDNVPREMLQQAEAAAAGSSSGDGDSTSAELRHMGHDVPISVAPSLAQNEIRLMRIEESPKPNELRFSLERHIRDTAPKYVALSYTCGNEPALHKIVLGDKVMKLRPNLWQALYYITSEKEAVDRTWKYIWCDAVCINQEDVAERVGPPRTSQTFIARCGANHSNGEIISARV